MTATDAAAHGVPSDLGPSGPDEEIVGYARSPSDALRLAVYGTIAVLILVLTRWTGETVAGIQRDIVSLVDFLSPEVNRILAGVAQVVVAFAALLVFVPAFVLRRYRLLGYIVVGNVIAAALFGSATWWLERAHLPSVANEAASAGSAAAGALDPRGLAQLAASFVILAPFVGARWRRAGAVTIAIVTVIRLAVTPSLPDGLFLALALGATAGCVVLLGFGRPDQRPTAAAVGVGLTSNGLDVGDLQPAEDTRAGVYRAVLTDGGAVYVRSASPADRSADLLYRMYRFLRLKNVGDERPFSSLRRAVEHEALVALRARDVGVRTPRLRALAGLGGDSMLLAYDWVDGRSLRDVADDAIDDDLLRSVWRQVATMHRFRIAHRDLHRGNILVGQGNEPWLVGFSFGEVAADDRLLASDVAQLLTATATAVGAERAVDAATAELGAVGVAAALPMVQPGALSGSTRTAIRGTGILDELREAIIARCAVEEPEYAQIDRFDARTALTVGTLALATYFLVPQLTDVPGILDQVADATWWWFPLVLVMSLVTYVGASIAMVGSVPDRIPTVPTFLAQVGTSFTGLIGPAGIGGMALNTRYLQKVGIDGPVAVTSVGLNAVAGFAAHILLLVVFLVWAGRSTFGSVSFPDPTAILYGVAVVAAITVIGFSIPAVRFQIAQRLVPVLRRSADGVAATLRHPGKVALLMGGSAVVSLGYILALYFSLLAFGADLSVAEVGAVYLAGSAVATAAPTPGGLGALEAAVIAGLVAAGVANAVAVPSVFLFRLATFWVPILPGWIAFHRLQRSEYL